MAIASTLVNDASAWSNGGYSTGPANPDYGTHDWIAQHALDWLPTQEKQYILNNLPTYLYGTELPDNNRAPDGIGDTAKHHIYYNSSGIMTDDAAAARAAIEYNNTLNFLKAKDYEKAAKNAGIMSHYIADMAVFGHVMGSKTGWGAEVHHSDYETYVNTRTSSYTAEFNSYLSFDGTLATVSAYGAAKNLAYDTTFDTNGDLTCLWMDQNYNWNNPTFKNRAGESLNLAVNYVTDVLHTLYQASISIPDRAYITTVPYHQQNNDYYCGPAALEMVFDFYGPDIPQSEIADVARTAPPPDGTYTPDMVRAAHFSNLSTSVGKEIPDKNITGYTARKLGYAAFEYRDMTLDQLKALIAAGYPIIVLTTWHFRVAVGYNSTHFTFQDSWYEYGPMYNMTTAIFDQDWDYYTHWALLVTPWKIEVSTPPNILAQRIFNLTATITYPLLPPFYTGQYPASASNVTLTLAPGLSLAPGETAKKTIGTGNLDAGTSTMVKWKVSADVAGNYTVRVDAEGKVQGSVPVLSSYPQPYSYTDRIGGAYQTTVEVISDDTPPVTVDDYDGLWHTKDFTITLTATDNKIGLAETYYKINNDPIKTVNADEQPVITTEAADNKLEYWSTDNAGNNETHHIITGIELDKTPPTGSIAINNGNTYTTTTIVTLTITAIDSTSGISQMRLSPDSITYTKWETYTMSKPWSILKDPDGPKTVYIQFKDNAGLTSNTYSDTIILDTAPPTLAITNPTQGSETKSIRITITWTGTDETSGISQYQIRLDNGTWINAQTNTTHTLVGLTSGTHTIDIKATDKAGNTKQESVNFTVNTNATTTAGPGYTTGIIITAAILAVIIGTATYLLKTKKKK